jgi:hypothetical protein
MEAVANGEINTPESEEHYRYQLRVMYQHLKKVFGSMPHDVKGRFAQPYRKSRTRRLDSRVNSMD